MSRPPPRSEDPRLLAARERLAAACVTGTNGKTTTTSMIAAIVAAAGERSARITTLGAWVGDERVSDEVSMDAFLTGLERAVAAGVRTLAVETTSKSLGSGFAWRWPAKVAVFTNLSRDHLDYHKTPEDYLAAKAQLFLAQPPDGLAVFNAADPSSALLADLLPRERRRVAYTARGVHPDCAALPLELSADEVRVDRDGTHVRLAASPLAEALGGALRLRIVGAVHAENALAAALAARGLGYGPAAIRSGLEAFPGVDGRFQVVLREPLAVVDYAHTPDALARTLDLARALAAGSGGRVWCVFGCGGDRDRGKRPQMGRIADERADEVVLTNDNPRGEDPERIADAIAAGAPSPRAHWTRELDRAAAIALALRAARPADVLIVAGKGHERTQSIGPRTLPFSDVEELHRSADARRR
ncbi:MAG: UDP-N-acetylmuramyl-tripeptide synthetase [Deltaproteobacteria bacterium]|nr:UDP-N-acetylmuramyl-tripeptide synthetase [Deltaproteobacteria bacterium]